MSENLSLSLKVSLLTWVYHMSFNILNEKALKATIILFKHVFDRLKFKFVSFHFTSNTVQHVNNTGTETEKYSHLSDGSIVRLCDLYIPKMSIAVRKCVLLSGRDFV